MKGYILTCPEKPAEFKRYEDYYRHLMKNVRDGIDVNDSLDILFAITYPVAYKRMKEWKNIERDIEQLTPVIATAFLKTVRAYDVSRMDASFLKLYELFIKREMIDEYFCTVDKERVLKFKYRGSELHLDTPMSSGDNDTETYANVIPDRKGSDIDVMILKDCIHDGLNYIFEQAEKEGVRRDRDLKRDKEIFSALVLSKLNGEHITQKELGRELGLTQSRICRVYNRYIDKLEKFVMEGEC